MSSSSVFEKRDCDTKYKEEVFENSCGEDGEDSEEAEEGQLALSWTSEWKSMKINAVILSLSRWNNCSDYSIFFEKE